MMESPSTSFLMKLFVIAVLFTLSACGGGGGGSGPSAVNDDPAAAGFPLDTDPVVIADPMVAEPGLDAAPVDADPVVTAPVDATPVDTAPVDVGPGVTAPVDAAPVDTAPVDANPVDTANPPGASPADSDPPVTDTDPRDEPPAIIADPADADPVVVADPMVRNSTRIDFDITVPAYISTAQQVRLVWDDKDIAASWVGDEFWSATDDFPTDTESLLVVTFYDDNGAVTLGSFEQPFRTGTNASESYRITADQFDTERWDRDGDGESNLDELVAGRDPLVSDTEDLEVRDGSDSSVIDLYEESWFARVSGFYESRLSSERPYLQDTDVSKPAPFGSSQPSDYPGIERSIVNIAIDDNGTGTFSDLYESDLGYTLKRENRVATRTNTGDSIIWSGIYQWSDYSSAGSEEIEFTTETEVIDAGLHRQTGSFTRDFSHNYVFTQHVSYSLTGMVIEGSTQCEAIAGTYEAEWLDNNARGPRVRRAIATKDADEQYWRVTRTNSQEQSPDEYLTQALGSDFYCEFSH